MQHLPAECKKVRAMQLDKLLVWHPHGSTVAPAVCFSALGRVASRPCRALPGSADALPIWAAGAAGPAGQQRAKLQGSKGGARAASTAFLLVGPAAMHLK